MANRQPAKTQGTRHSNARSERRVRHERKGKFRRIVYLVASGFIGSLIIVSLFVPSFGGNGGGTSPESEDPFPIIPEGTNYFGYASQPPTSGPAWEKKADWGIHTTAVPNERQVRNLLEGGVLIQYNTEDSNAINTLKDVVTRQGDYPCYLIMAPYTDMESNIAMTAWGAIETMGNVNTSQIQQFIDTYRGGGPKTQPCDKTSS